MHVLARHRLHALVAIALAALVLPAAAEGQARLPASYVLPGATVFPEGIAVQGDHYYVTSTTDGTIFRGRLDRRRARVYLRGGANGRTTAIGLEAVRKRLIVAGGATGRVFVYSTATGRFVRGYSNGPAPDRPTFLNDAAAAPNGDIYVTDSMRPIIHRIAADSIRHRSTNTDALSVFLDLTGSAFVYQQPGVNANGIVATPDGRYLLVVQSNAGKLFRIGLADRSVTEVSIGADTLRNGDGMELQGQRLYVARNRDGIVVRVDMSRDYGSGRVVRALSGAFRFPTTLAGVGRRLLVVNAQFDRRAMPGQPAPMAPNLPFTVSSVRRP